MVPGAWVVQAQKFRRWFHDAVMKIFDEVDVIIAPATPCRAPLIGQKNMVLDGVEMMVRANLGIFTQPISFIGLPVVTVPLWSDGERLPMGVQIISAPWREDLALRVAHDLACKGVARAPVAASASLPPRALAAIALCPRLPETGCALRPGVWQPVRQRLFRLGHARLRRQSLFSAVSGPPGPPLHQPPLGHGQGLALGDDHVV
jgi:hypothetical protein